MSIDYRPLIVPLSREEVRQFKRESRENGRPWASGSSVGTAVAIAAGLVMAVVAVGLFSSTVPMVLELSGAGVSPAILLGPVLLVAFGALIAYGYIAHASQRWESLLRRSRFAAVNALTYLPGLRNPEYPGLIFLHGDSRQTADNYRSTGEPEFDIGNYRYTTGSGKNKTTHTWGYLALRLERNLPHMVLDARRNNGLLGASTLPTAFRRDQRLSLEGDFDQHFTLYCPRQYERDALYVFTPDLMALLIDESAAFDVEIVDDWMFVYSVEPFRLDEAATVSRLFRIIETVGAKTLRQTDRYADEKIGDAGIDLVAAQGQRLKKSYTLAGAGVVVVFAWVAFSFARAWL